VVFLAAREEQEVQSLAQEASVLRRPSQE